MKTIVKQLLLGTGRRGRRIPFGLYKGLVLSIDPTVETSFYLGLYEVETAPWLRQAVLQAQSLVDVGTGAGELSMWGLAHANIRRVLAYDASPERWHIFRENQQLNGFEADERLTAVEGRFLGRQQQGEAEEILGCLPEPILFKIDVEGGEEAILERMRSFLATKRCLLLVETHSKMLDESCRRVLEAAGYEVRSLTPAWWRCFWPENRPLPFNQWLVAGKK